MIPRVKRKNAYQHASEFHRDQIIIYRDCCLSYCGIAACVGRDSMTVHRVQNRWVQEGHSECRVGSQLPSITNGLEGRHLASTTLMNHTATLRDLNLHSLPKVKDGEENANFWKKIRIEEDDIRCRGRWKYANMLGNSQQRLYVKKYAKRAVL